MHREERRLTLSIENVSYPSVDILIERTRQHVVLFRFMQYMTLKIVTITHNL